MYFTFVLLIGLVYSVSSIYWVTVGIKTSSQHSFYVKYMIFPSYCIQCLGRYIKHFIMRQPQSISMVLFTAAEPTPLTPIADVPIRIECNGWTASETTHIAVANVVPVPPSISKADIPVCMNCNGWTAAVVDVVTVRDAGANPSERRVAVTAPILTLSGEPFGCPEPISSYRSLVVEHLPTQTQDFLDTSTTKLRAPSPQPCVEFRLPGAPLNSRFPK